MGAMITLRDVYKTYSAGDGIFNALFAIDLLVSQGEFLSIMGRSGSGKSTLLNIIGGIDTLDNGEYIYLDKEVHTYTSRQLTKFRRQLGFVFQSFHLLPQSTVFQNIELPLGYAGIRSDVRIKTVESLLEKVGLGNKRNSYPSELSGGQMQRVAIARALAVSPKLLLADEPTGNLDSENSKIVMELLADIHKEGTTIILVTHDDKISDFASRKIVMADGKIIS
jgi:putative ABC transport system ATP-binding protein